MVTNLKKVVFWLVFCAIGIFGLLPLDKAMAEAVTPTDLGIETTGILPSNPFYFFKSWGRSIRQSLSFSDIKRAELQLDFLNEQVAEMQKLTELSPDNLNAFLKALANFGDRVKILKSNLDILKKGDAALYPFIKKLLSQSLKYQEVVEGLSYDSKDLDEVTEFRAAQARAMDQLVAATASILNGLVDGKKFGELFEAAVAEQRGGLKELRGVEFIDRLQSAAGEQSALDMLKLEDSLLLKWDGGLQALLADEEAMSAVENALEEGSGDLLRRLRALDAAREKTTNADLKNRINLMRQRILEKVKSQNIISADKAEKMLADAAERIAEASSWLVGESKEAAKNAAEAIARARFNFEGAEQFFENEAFANAYSQALVASAAADSALTEFLSQGESYAEELKGVKQYFDSLTSAVNKVGAGANKGGDILASLATVEAQIGKASDLVKKKPDSSEVAMALRQIKTALAAISQSVENLSRPASVDEGKNGAGAKGSSAKSNGSKNEVGKKAFIVISGGQFVPAVVRVKRGDTVTWSSQDENGYWLALVSRTDQAALPSFGPDHSSGKDEKFSFVFDKTGSWKYYNRLAPEMAGVVQVE